MGHHHEQKVPRGALWGALGLMVFAVGISAVARHQADEAAAIAEAEAERPVATVDLRFEDRPNGSIGVLDLTGREVSTVPPMSNGFIRGVLRGMFRHRKLESMDREAPFRLSQYDDGHLSLEDLESGRVVDLSSFGPTNHAAFAELLQAGRMAQR